MPLLMTQLKAIVAQLQRDNASDTLLQGMRIDGNAHIPVSIATDQTNVRGCIQVYVLRFASAPGNTVARYFLAGVQPHGMQKHVGGTTYGEPLIEVPWTHVAASAMEVRARVGNDGQSPELALSSHLTLFTCQVLLTSPTLARQRLASSVPLFATFSSNNFDALSQLRVFTNAMKHSQAALGGDVVLQGIHTDGDPRAVHAAKAQIDLNFPGCAVGSPLRRAKWSVD